MPGPSLQVNLGTQANSTAGVTPAYPDNTQKGALCFLMCSSKYNETVTLSDAQGFQLLGAINSLDTTSTGCRATIFWKIAEGTEPARGLGDAMTAPTVADPGDHVVARIINYTSFWPGYEIESVNTEGFASTAANTNISLTGMVVNQLASEVIYFVADGVDSAASRVVTYAQGTNAGAVEGNDFTTGTTDGTGGGINFAASNVNPQATVGTATWKSTLGPSGYAAVKVVLRCPIIRYVTTNSTAGTAAVVASVPAHGATDLLLLVVQTANESVVTPSGWTFVGNIGTGTAGSGTAQWVYQLIDATAAVTTVTVADPGDHAFCKVHRFPGVRISNPINGVATNSGTGNTATFPTLTTTVDGCTIVYLVSNQVSSAGGPTISSTPMTAYVNTTAGGPNVVHMRNSTGALTGTTAGGLSIGVANQNVKGALGTTTVSINAAGGNWTTMTIALEPDGARVAFTQAGDTVAATAAQTDNATVSFTQAANTVAATAAQLNRVVVNFTQAGDAIAGTITHPTVAQVAFTQAGDSVAASTIQVDPAQIAITQAPNTVAAAATQTDKAVVAFTQVGDVVAGTITHPTVAVVAFTQANNAVVAAGSQLQHAAVSFTQANQTVAASAIQVNPAQIAVTQAPNTVAAEVQLPSIGTDSPAYGIQPITVNWTRLGDKGAGTIIALARQGADEADMVAWVYTNGTQVAPGAVVANGSYTFPAVTTPGTYVARVITSGAPAPTWTLDATSGIGVPVDSSEWDDVMAAATIASGGPSHMWELQVITGPADSIGSEPLGGTISGNYAVTGWAREAVGFIDTGGGAFYNTNIGDSSIGSVMLLAYVRIAANGGVRDLCGISSGADYRGAQISAAGHYRAIENSGSTTADGSVSVDDSVHPILVQVNVTAGTFKIYTDIEVITGPYVAPVGAGALIIFGAAVTQTPTDDILYAAEWEGAAAEITQAEAKRLLQTLGHTVPWS